MAEQQPQAQPPEENEKKSKKTSRFSELAPPTGKFDTEKEHRKFVIIMFVMFVAILIIMFVMNEHVDFASDGGI